MGIQDNVLNRTKLQVNRIETVPKNKYCLSIAEFKEFLNELLDADRYIARSDYNDRLELFADTFRFFQTLQNGGMLQEFCLKNAILPDEVARIIEKYHHIREYVNQHNEDYISTVMKKEKEYLDHILKQVDPMISLDDDQRRAILTDEDYCLIIAGAGAGKTTTVAAKVKYLVEKQGIDPSKILVISYTNKAVNELKERININLGIACPIATFHSTGNAIIHKNNPSEVPNIVDSSKMYFVLRDYFRNSILQNEALVNKLIMFFASYFDAQIEGNDLNAFFNQIAKANFSTMRGDLEDFKREVIDQRTKKSVTIQNEVLRSHQEVEIANFLYLNNIDYEYEPFYQYNIYYARKPYTPDFIIKQDGKTAYIEHFGVSENGKNNRFSQEEIDAYKKAVNDKIMLHRQHGTTLIYTFSEYNDGRGILEHLKEQLERNGFEVQPRSNKEVMEMLVAGEENRYIRRLLNLICRFISNFKVNGYTFEEFNRMYHSTQNVRSRLFLDICTECFLEYEKYLKEGNAIDFDDMINESARILRNVKEMKQKLDFKYVIVDEYQDISRQRFDLTKILSEVTDAKIIAVGDDWQSIYAFSGSDITLFTKFEKIMGYAKLLKIVRTYRNAQEVIDIAGSFIQKNKEQITKALESPKSITDPIIIYTYDGTNKSWDGDRRSGVAFAIAHAVETALEQIMEYNRQQEKKQGSILLLGRFGFDCDQLERSGLFENPGRSDKLKSVKHPKLDITYMTAHSSKGLGYDDVIVVNGKNDIYGFPSKIEDDPILSFVIKGDRSIDYAEERRLFYVAMTRTKNRVYFIAPKQNPSEFLLELKRDYKNVDLRGNWNEEAPKRSQHKACPICGYPMQYKYKNAYGLRLYICTNEPEICGFMTNDIKAEKLSIIKCDRCRDGYLIVKLANKGEYFLGCTNYKENGTGCHGSLSKKQYYEMMSYAFELVNPEKSDNQSDVLSENSEKTKSVIIVPEITKNIEKQVSDIKSIEHQVITNNSEQTSENGIEGKAVKTAEEDIDTRKGKAIAESIEKKIKIKRSQLRNKKYKIQNADLKPVIYQGWDLSNVVCIVLNEVLHASDVRFYGIPMHMNVLRGMVTEKLLKAKLDTVAEFGLLNNFPREDLVTIIDWMIKKHFLLKTKAFYPVLHMTYDGMHYKDTITRGKLIGLKKYLTEG